MGLRPRRWLAAVCLVAATGLAACGKKGPPLAPFVRVPGAAGPIVARRVGGDIILTFTLPAQNVDTSTPVALGRVDVYGYTGRTAPPAARFGEVARLVGTIDATKEPAPIATLRDTLSADELVAGPPVAQLESRSGASPPAVPARDQTRAPLRRYYMAVALSDRGRPGPPSAIVDLPLTPTPDAPPEVRASYTVDTAVVSWTPSGGLVGFVLDRAPLPPASPLDDGPPVTEPGTLPPGPTRYNVYRETTAALDDAAAAGTAATRQTAPVNSAPIDALTFTEPIVLDGRRLCYTVTALRGTGDRAFEGVPSEPACITAIDTFPPVAPTGLSPIAVEGEISLVWEANTEADLGGYRVWRGEAGDTVVLSPITEQVVTETRFTDRTVRPGVRYVYAVTAVDRRTPEPNVSPESERVEVNAR